MRQPASGHSISPGPGSRGAAHSPPAAAGRPSDNALIISGSIGKYALINGTYEPRGMHGKFPCWTAVYPVLFGSLAFQGDSACKVKRFSRMPPDQPANSIG